MPSPQDRVLLACFILSKSPGVAAGGRWGKRDRVDDKGTGGSRGRSERLYKSFQVTGGI